jgi:hypothetical protein
MAARQSARFRKNATPIPNLEMIHPPPPGQGKRGEQGNLAYLLRQAQAATRLTLERSLADLGVTPPRFAVLTMLKAYPGLSCADLARVAADPADRRRDHPEPGTRRRDQKDAASGARKGAAVDADPPRRDPARKVPASCPIRGAAVDGRTFRQGSGDGPALAVQNCRRPAAGWRVPGVATLPRRSLHR